MTKDDARLRLMAFANLEDRRALEQGVPFELRAWGFRVQWCLDRARELSTLVPGTELESIVTGRMFLLQADFGCVFAVQRASKQLVTVAAWGLADTGECPGCARLWPLVSRRVGTGQLVRHMGGDGCWHTRLALTPAEELELSCLG